MRMGKEKYVRIGGNGERMGKVGMGLKVEGGEEGEKGRAKIQIGRGKYGRNRVWGTE